MHPSHYASMVAAASHLRASSPELQRGAPDRVMMTLIRLDLSSKYRNDISRVLNVIDTNHYIEPTLEFLGGGAFGAVFSVENSDGKKIALKAFSNRNMFNWERKIYSQLPKISGVPQMLGAYPHDLVLAVQYLEGISLQTYYRIHRSEFLSIDIIKSLFYTLAELHEHGIYHRDIKPENIMIVNENGKRVPYFVDFGLSCDSKSSDPVVSTECMTHLHGTKDYFGPQRGQNFESVCKNKADCVKLQESIDVYALIVTILKSAKSVVAVGGKFTERQTRILDYLVAVHELTWAVRPSAREIYYRI